MNIQIRKISDQEIEKLGIKNWPVWSKEVSEFDWYYDSNEMCYFIEGEVIVKTLEKEYKIKEGDFVIFPRGLKCKWIIKKPVKKHYNFD